MASRPTGGSDVSHRGNAAKLIDPGALVAASLEIACLIPRSRWRERTASQA